MDVTSTQEINFPTFNCRKIKDAPVTSPKSQNCYDYLKLHRYALNLDSGKKNN